MKKWAYKYDSCKDCGSTEHPHEGKGLCKRCYKKNHYKYKEKIHRFYKFYKNKKRIYAKQLKGKFVRMRFRDGLIPTPFFTDQEITEREMFALNEYLRGNYGNKRKTK